MSTIGTAGSLLAEFNFSSRKAATIALNLMTKAVKQGRETEMLDKISFHFNRAHDMPEGHEEGLALAQYYDLKCGPSQSLRKLSLSTGHVYEDNERPKPVLN